MPDSPCAWSLRAEQTDATVDVKDSCAAWVFKYWVDLPQVCKAKGVTAATLLDTKGPEIRTAMLRGKKIKLEAGQPIIVEAVGDRYTEFEGYKDEETGETRIGLSYAKLCQSVKPGNRILLADGSISIRVDEILSETELNVSTAP